MPNASDIRAGGAVVEIGGDTTRLNRALRGAQGKLKQFSAFTDRMASRLMNIRTLGVTIALGGAAREAVRFEAQMAHVATMLEDTGVGGEHAAIFKSMEKDVRRLARSYGQSVDTISNSLYDLLSATIAPADATDVLAATLKGATAGGTSAAVATQGLIGIMNNYGLAGKDAADIMDLMFATVKRGVTTFPELASVIGVAASATGSAGLAMEELSAAFSTVTRGGINTHMAATAIRSSISALANPNKKLIALTKKYGLELDNTTVKTKGLVPIIHALKQATSAEIAVTFNDMRTRRALNKLLQDSAGFEKDLQLAKARAGGTEAAYQKRSATVQFKLNQLSQQAIDIYRDIGQAILTVLQPRLQGITDFVKSIGDWVKANKAVIASLTQMGFTVAKVVGGALALGAALKIAFFVFSPTGMLGIALLGLAAVLDSMYDLNTGALTFFKNMRVAGVSLASWWAVIWTEIKAIALRAWMGIQMGFDTAAQGLDNIITWFVGVWKQFITYLETPWMSFLAKITLFFAKMNDKIAAGLNWLIKQYNKAVPKLMEVELRLRTDSASVVRHVFKKELAAWNTKEKERRAIAATTDQKIIRSDADLKKKWANRRAALETGIEADKEEALRKVRVDAAKGSFENIRKMKDRIAALKAAKGKEKITPEDAAKTAIAGMDTKVIGSEGTFSAFTAAGLGSATTSSLLKKSIGVQQQMNNTLQTIAENTEVAPAATLG